MIGAMLPLYPQAQASLAHRPDILSPDSLPPSLRVNPQRADSLPIDRIHPHSGSPRGTSYPVVHS